MIEIATDRWTGTVTVRRTEIIEIDRMNGRTARLKEVVSVRRERIVAIEAAVGPTSANVAAKMTAKRPNRDEVCHGAALRMIVPMDVIQSIRGDHHRRINAKRSTRNRWLDSQIHSKKLRPRQNVRAQPRRPRKEGQSPVALRTIKPI